MVTKYPKSRSKKTTAKAEKQPILSKDQKQLLQYYGTLPTQDRKDVLKFIKIISDSHLAIVEKKGS